MAMARMREINASVARWYHCMTRCVRRAFLLGAGTSDRKEWIENRIEDRSEGTMQRVCFSLPIRSRLQGREHP
jgi:hypothetical protein